MPEEERYDGYLQLENGVGMIRLLLDEFHDGLKRRTAEKEAGKSHPGKAPERSLWLREDWRFLI